MKAHKLATFILAAGLMSIPKNAIPQDAVGVLTLGVVLDHLADRLSGLVSQTGAEFRTSTYAASGQVNTLIDNTRTAYHDELNETKDKWDVTLKSSVDQIGTTLDHIENHLQLDIDSDLTKIEVIEDALPITDKTPRLTDQQPYLQYVTGPFFVTFKGHFPYAAESAYQPSITVEDSRSNKKTILTPSLVTLTELQFSLSPDVITNSDNKIIGMTKLNLAVPYKTSCIFLWCFSSSVSNFPSYLGALPAVAGHVKVSDLHIVTQNVIENRTSSTVGMSSEGCCDRGPSPVCDPASIPSGWHYVPNSASMIELDQHGGRKGNGHQWDEEGPVVSTSVCWQVQTWQHKHGRDGTISFKIKYQLSHDVNSDNSSSLIDTDVAWNSSRIIQLMDNTKNWVVEFKPFDGPVVQFAKEGVSKPPYLTIAAPSANQLQLIVAPPPEVR